MRSIKFFLITFVQEPGQPRYSVKVGLNDRIFEAEKDRLQAMENAAKLAKKTHRHKQRQSRQSWDICDILRTSLIMRLKEPVRQGSRRSIPLLRWVRAEVVKDPWIDTEFQFESTWFPCTLRIDFRAGFFSSLESIYFHRGFLCCIPWARRSTPTNEERLQINSSPTDRQRSWNNRNQP